MEVTCEQYHCIYQEERRCRLDVISVDAAGLCGECILVELSGPRLAHLKRVQRGRLEYSDRCAEQALQP